MNRIAFSGKMGAGKSSSCILIHQEALGNARKYSFAEKLKEMVGDLFGVDPYSKELDVRNKLQLVGSYMRELDVDVWVKYLIRIINEDRFESMYDGIQMIDDLRYKNEFWALKKEGFIIIRLDAPPEIRYNRMKHNLSWEDFLEASKHPSEVDLDGVPDFEWDFKFDSSKSIEEMQNDIRVALFRKEPL